MFYAPHTSGLRTWGLCGTGLRSRPGRGAEARRDGEPGAGTGRDGDGAGVAGVADGARGRPSTDGSQGPAAPPVLGLGGRQLRRVLGLGSRQRRRVLGNGVRQLRRVPGVGGPRRQRGLEEQAVLLRISSIRASICPKLRNGSYGYSGSIPSRRLVPEGPTLGSSVATPLPLCPWVSPTSTKASQITQRSHRYNAGGHLRKSGTVYKIELIAEVQQCGVFFILFDRTLNQTTKSRQLDFMCVNGSMTTSSQDSMEHSSWSITLPRTYFSISKFPALPQFAVLNTCSWVPLPVAVDRFWQVQALCVSPRD
ncbi:hypothetical protein EYF80_011828 [Liparis tanakae]|uniref:Uncharacterized protein n=1 Tax=Liparis tanakae TaxID=230148 RepID=A0A4Z2IJD5_9TELE|nr:hypothetical protein EYF80_011828 [Liparis tanakae]